MGKIGWAHTGTNESQPRAVRPQTRRGKGGLLLYHRHREDEHRPPAPARGGRRQVALPRGTARGRVAAPLAHGRARPAEQRRLGWQLTQRSRADVPPRAERDRAQSQPEEPAVRAPISLSSSSSHSPCLVSCYFSHQRRAMEFGQAWHSVPPTAWVRAGACTFTRPRGLVVALDCHWAQWAPARDTKRC